MLPFVAIWDTGATNSVITQAVVDACGLLPTGMTKVSDVRGDTQAETYLVNIGCPPNMLFYGARATKGKLTGNADVLIGMNIINKGDFAVTHPKGVTQFTFRIPSGADINFVRDANEVQRPRAQHRNIPKPKRPKRTKPSGSRKGKRKRSRKK